MKKKFDESKHRRDELGRFAKMSISELKKRQTIELDRNNAVPPTLSKVEFAMWYNKIGEIERGGYVDKTPNGNKLIPINNKIAVTAGTYVKPILVRVLEFDSLEEMHEGLTYLNGE